ncbi:hypothetical protein [Dactylosporangium sp. CA-233914]|uniref:hypothetical protein n=1 Tax=Dactylosporangium sp. CA-233914 TaxID=3239934 RepID=UPI003D8B89AB
MRLLPTVLVLSLAACSSPAPTPAPTRTACGSPVDTGPLPQWARGGFSGPTDMPHVLGDRGEIVGAVFGFPLSATPRPDRANKILWVAKDAPPPGDLTIEARLDGTTTSQTRQVPGGPGPSIVDLPAAGCWHLTLTWPAHTDTMDLVYN